MRRITYLILITIGILSGCKGITDDEIKNAVYNNYYAKPIPNHITLIDLGEFESVAVLKKLTEGNQCLALCEITLKPKEIKLKSELTHSSQKYDPAESKESNEQGERMQLRYENGEIKQHNKDLSYLSKSLAECNYKFSRTFVFYKFGSDWFYKGQLTSNLDPYREINYKCFEY